METLYVTSFTVLQRGIILSNTFSVTQLYDKYLNILVAIVYELRLTCYFNIYKLLLILMSWPENQGILFFYISKTLEMIRISFMASLLNAVL